MGFQKNTWGFEWFFWVFFGLFFGSQRVQTAMGFQNNTWGFEGFFWVIFGTIVLRFLFDRKTNCSMDV